MFEQAIKSVRETTSNYDVEIIAVIDDDEITKDIALKNNCIVDYSPIRRGALKSWNIGLSHATGDILFPFGDDSLCHPLWLDYALESHRERLGGFGMVGLNDGAYDGNLQLATVVLYDRAFCKSVLGGVAAYECYHYYCVDSELNYRARNAARFYWDSRSIVEHLHSAHGKREFDRHDAERQINNWMVQDNELFEQRRVENFPNNFKSIL